MILRVKTLGICLSASLVIGAALVSVASADQFTTDPSASVTLEGSQVMQLQLKTTAGSAECKKAVFLGAVTTPTSTVTLAPTYSECNCIGVSCEFHFNSCKFVLHMGAGTQATADIECVGSEEITITSSKCTIHIPAQTNLSKVEMKNTGSGSTKEVLLDFELAKISYSHTAGEGVGKCTTGSSSTATLTGTVKTTANKGGSHIALFVD